MAESNPFTIDPSNPYFNTFGHKRPIRVNVAAIGCFIYGVVLMLGAIGLQLLLRNVLIEQAIAEVGSVVLPQPMIWGMTISHDLWVIPALQDMLFGGMVMLCGFWLVSRKPLAPWLVMAVMAVITLHSFLNLAPLLEFYQSQEYLDYIELLKKKVEEKGTGGTVEVYDADSHYLREVPYMAFRAILVVLPFTVLRWFRGQEA